MDYYKKKYDEALERARKLKENPQSVFNEYSPKEGDTICDYIFPELKESEDEKIRKELIDIVAKSPITFAFEDKNKVLSWLEKQGELVNSLTKGLDNAHERIDELIQKNNELCINLEKQGEQKHAWSEEDEKMVANLVDYFKVDDALQYTEKQVVDWLKSLKQRIAP